MKKSKFIKLFSALLCIVMLFVSCGDNAGTENNAKPKDDLSYTDLIADYKDSAQKITEAKKLGYGEVIYQDSSIIIFEDIEVDASSNANVKTTVYNSVLGKPVVTLESKIAPKDLTTTPNGNGIANGVSFVYLDNIGNDFDDKYVDVIVVASVKENKISDAEYRKTLKALRDFYGVSEEKAALGTPTNEAERHYFSAVEDIDTARYDITYEVYDLLGNKVDTFVSKQVKTDELYGCSDYDVAENLSEAIGFQVQVPRFSWDYYVEYVGQTDIIYNAIELPKKQVYKIDDKAYTFATEYMVDGDYSIYFIYSFAGSASVAGNRIAPPAIEVGDFDVYVDYYGENHDGEIDYITIAKKDVKGATEIDVMKLAHEYYDGTGNGDSFYGADLFALENGKLLLKLELIYTGKFDGYTYTDGGKYYDVVYLLINPASGLYKEVLTDANYVIDTVMPMSDYLKALSLTMNNGADNEKLVGCNMLVSSPIVRDESDKRTLGEERTALVDGEFNLKLSLDEKFVLEHDSGKGIRPLAGGNYLVPLVATAPSEYAIASADGVIRTYLPDGFEEKIVGEYIVTDKAIYDFDLKLIFDFEENDVDGFEIYCDTIFVHYVDKAHDEFMESDDKNFNGITDSKENYHPHENDKNGNGIDDYEEEDFELDAEIEDLWNDDSGFYVLVKEGDALVMQKYGESTDSDNPNEDAKPYPFTPYNANVIDKSDYYMVVGYTNDNRTVYVLYNDSFETVAVSTEEIIVDRYGDFFYTVVNGEFYALNGAVVSK